MTDQHQLFRAYAGLKALKDNLPEGGRFVYGDLVNKFHNELDRLQKQGFDVEEYRIPETSFRQTAGGRAVDSRLLHTNIDSLLNLFSLQQSGSDIGFHG